LPGEAQKIDRLMNAFARQYYTQNKDWDEVFEDMGMTFFNSFFFNEFVYTTDAVYIMAVSTMMLNTDAHNPNVKEKMTLKQFINNNRGINAGGSSERPFFSS
jgi:Sec7-like guanine-nucleotide exchange factor